MTKKDLSLRSRAESFSFAFSGFMVLLKTQKNFQIHIVAGVVAILLSLWLQITRTQFAIILICIAMVLTAEALNTALEMVVNMFSAQRSWPAKWTKDVAAAGVLITAIAAFAVGCLILAPPLYERFLLML